MGWQEETVLLQVSVGCALEEGPSSKQVPCHCQRYDAREERGCPKFSLLSFRHHTDASTGQAQREVSQEERAGDAVHSGHTPRHKTTKTWSRVKWDRERLQNNQQRLDSYLLRLNAGEDLRDYFTQISKQESQGPRDHLAQGHTIYMLVGPFSNDFLAHSQKHIL